MTTNTVLTDEEIRLLAYEELAIWSFDNQIYFARAIEQAVLAKVSGNANMHNPAIPAIQFAIRLGDGVEGLTWLRCWNEGNFKACREEWAEFNPPEECFIGADPLHATRSRVEGSHDS